MSHLVNACLLLLAIASAQQALASTDFKEKSLLFEDFGDGWDSRWVQSSNSKYTGKFEQVNPEAWPEGASAIQAPEKSKHYGITTLLSEPVDPSKGLVVQYEVKYPDGVTCGGSYLKLLTHNPDFQPEQLDDQSPYSIMFGPDKCGSGKVHLIFRHTNPVNGTVEEKHLKEPPLPLTDKTTHVYTLILEPNNRYSVLIDGEEKSSGSLLDSFSPAFVPPKEIPDPEDIKPADWVDQAKISDPSATKPDDWVEEAQILDVDAKKPSGWLDDEPAEIDDKKAKKPADWDDEEDGEWAPPKVPNPKCKKVGCGPWTPPMKANPDYKGPWKAPIIDNPAYKGPWVQKTIPNPHYFEDKEPLTNVGKIGAVAIEIWTVDSGYTFSNILLTQDKALAKTARSKLWKAKHDAEEKAEEEKAQQAEEEAAKAKGEKPGIAKVFQDIANSEAVSFAKPQLDQLADLVEAYPALGYVLMLTPLVLFFALTTYCTALGRRRNKLDAAAARKKDDDLPELEGDEDEEGEEKKEGEEVVAAADEDVAAGTSTAEAEETEDAAEDSKPAARQRRRHA